MTTISIECPVAQSGYHEYRLFDDGGSPGLILYCIHCLAWNRGLATMTELHGQLNDRGPRFRGRGA